MDEEHHRRLERMYHSAPANQRHDPRLDVEAGSAVVEMNATEAMHHAADAVHGAYLFKLLDDAAFFAANSLVDTFVLTVHFDVHLLKPVQGGPMTARGEVVHESPSAILVEAVVHDADGDQAARGTGSFVKGKRSLDEIEGYANA